VPTVALDARDAFSPQLRGWGRYAQRLVQAFHDAPPDDLDVLVLQHGSRGPEVAFEQVGLPRLLRRRDADAVHAPNCFLPLRRPCPGVVTVHDLAFEEFPGDFAPRTRVKYRRLGRRAVRSAERVIVDAEYTRHDLERRWGVDPARIRVIPLAAALPAGREEPPSGPYVLAIGDLRAKKNLGRLVQAYARLRAQGLEHRLELAGLDTGEGERVRAAAAGAPVELAGYVSDARLDALLRGADLLVHPSLYEGFGFVVLEAMERGCPVAVSDATCLPETAGHAAELFDARDTDAIAAAVTAVLDHPARRGELVEAGRRHAAGFDWARTAQRTLDVYREVL
jgi:glycosyltransferase involved in cell wall biosynthesis